MSYIERSKQNAMDKEELKAFRARQADDTIAALTNAAALEERARNQAVIDSLLRDRARTPYSPYTGIDSAEFLQETRYMADGGATDADMAAANYSQSLKNQNTGPGIYDKVKGLVGNLFAPSKETPKLSAFAERELLAEQDKVNKAAQEADRTLQGYK
jgi:hypothetical protein